MLTHLDLFSGIGGFALATRWTGAIDTIGFCEIDKFCVKVLNKHWPEVAVHGEIRTLTAATVQAMADASQRESQQRDGGGMAETERDGKRGNPAVAVGREVDIITGGFPCQPFSVAGKRRGKADNRYLWPEMLRVITECRPRWIVGENVAGIVGMALDTVCADLEGIGYTVRPVIVPACAVAAPHRRDRVWIVAHGECVRRGGGRDADAPRNDGSLQAAGSCPADESEFLAHRDSAGRQEHGRSKSVTAEHRAAKHGGNAMADSNGGRHQQRNTEERSVSITNAHGWQTQFGMGSGADGLPAGLVQRVAAPVEAQMQAWSDGSWEAGLPRTVADEPGRVARLRALGNAIVPQVAYMILQNIVDIESHTGGDDA